MRVCTRPRALFPVLVAAAALVVGALPMVVADFSVADIQPKLEKDALTLAGRLEFGLTPKVEEALSKGIPLEVVIDVRLRRERPFLWDENMGDWQLRRRIRYHALSGQYLVSSDGVSGPPPESFTSLSEALKQMGAIADIRLPLARPPADSESYAVSVRASLDIEALPAPLRPVAYTSLAWHLNSGWNTWTAAR